MLSYLIRRRFPNWQLIFAQTNILHMAIKAIFFSLKQYYGFSPAIGNLDKWAADNFCNTFWMKFQQLW